MKYLKRNTLLILLILIITLGIVITIFSSCETEQRPNLIIGNHFATGQLYIIDLPTEETIISESFELWDEKYLYVDIGNYKVKLIADSGNDPARQNRQITILVNSIRSQTKVLFK